MNGNMENGTFTIFVIENRWAARSDTSKGKLIKVPEGDSARRWRVCHMDNFACSLSPHIGTGNAWRPKYRKVENELRNSYQKVGLHGFVTLDHAIAAIKRLRKDDADGHYDSRDNYGKMCGAIRREFRISRVNQTFQRTIEPLTVEDVVEAA